MAWNNPDHLVIGGGGEVYVADYVSASSPTLPTNATTDPVAAYYGTGYLSEDGVTVSVTPNVQDFPVWQSRQPGRRETLAQEIAFSGQFAQWNEQTLSVCFGKGVAAVTPGSTASFSFPGESDALKELSVIVDVVDGNDRYRFHAQRTNQTEASATQFNRSNLAVLPFSFKVLAPTGGGSPATFFTNADGFAVGS